MVPWDRSGKAETAGMRERYATERRRQMAVLCVLAAAVLAASVLRTGLHSIFLPGWWRIDLP